MITIFGDPAFLHDDDPVGVTHSRESMSNHDRCDLAELLFHSFNCFLDFSLIDLIQCTCSLVKDQQFWLFDESPSQCDPLLLASRQLVTASTHIRLNALWLILDELPCVCLFECVNDLIVCGIGLAHEYVLLN